eukprot:5538501-Pyramimonas_sp.AAC.1
MGLAFYSRKAGQAPRGEQWIRQARSARCRAGSPRPRAGQSRQCPAMAKAKQPRWRQTKTTCGVV